MLIVLSEELRREDLRVPLSPCGRDALVNLAIAVYEGKHLVTGSRQLFGDVQQLVELGQVCTSHFKNASALISDANALRSEVSAYILVHPIGRKARVEIEHTVGVARQLVFHLPLDHFAESECASCSWLVGEHIRDAVTYVALGEAFSTPFRGYHCRLRTMDGHGGATPQTFKLLAELNNSVLCIVDSDQDAPAAPLGQTATQTLVCHSELRVLAKVADAHILPCRELENLLPAKLVVDALPPDLKDPHRIKVLAQQERLGKVDFAEVKDLVRLQQVSEHLGRLTPQKRAELCFSGNVHAALLKVGALIWSFGLAPRRGRT